VQPGTPPPSTSPPGLQRPWGGGAESPPTQSHKPMPPEVERVQAFRMPPSLDEANVVDHRKYAPRSGWRRAVHRATRGHVDPGDSPKDHAQEDLLAQIRQSIVGDFRIAVLSIKGGVGKTTTTLGLGSALATARPDRVIAVDANPDRGTLAERVRDVSTSSTVRDLLSDPNISRYADIRNHTRMAVSRLEVLASEQDPAAADVFDEADYRRTIDILGHYYNIILTDCGTGIMHSAMAGVLDLAHTIVLVSSPAIDAVRSASATLEWLMRHGHSGLVGEGHVVLSASRPGSATLKMDKVYEFFEARCRSIHFVPFDPHLAEGADVDFGLLKPATRQAYLELAGAVAEHFPRLRADRNHT
jgi:MinD-like ATPase involved in chromosome partitioning or flagellar assembly